MNNYDKLRFVGILKDKVFIGPQMAVFHLINVCNLKCIYCWFHSPFRKNVGERKKQELDFGAFKKVIDDCSELNVKWIKLSGQGEPTLHSRIIDMIDYVKKKNFLLTFFTNGTFSKEILQHLIKADEIKITLSSTNSNKYREIQSGNSRDIFEKVIRNISFLTALKKYRKNPYIQINYILNSENYNELPQIFRLASILKVDYLKIISPELSAYNRKIRLKKEAYKEINLIFNKIIKQSYFSKIASNVKFNYKPNRGFLDKLDLVKTEACYHGWYYAFINFDGNVTPCCNFNKVLVAGNIYENSFKEIWYSKAFHKIRLDGKYTLYGQLFYDCQTCSFRKFNNELHEKLKRFK